MSSLALLPVLFIVLHYSWSVCVGCHQPSHHTPQTPHRLFSSRTAYEHVRGHDVQGAGQLHDSGCTATQLYLVSRHGQRYPGRDDIEAMASQLSQIQDMIKGNKQNGALSDERLKAIVDWTMTIQPKDHLGITKQGLKDMHNLGRRLKELFGQPLDCSRMDNVDIIHTNTSTGRRSVRALLRGLCVNKDSNDNLSWSHQTFKSANFSRDKQLLLFLDNCSHYLQTRQDPMDQERQEIEYFDEGDDMSSVIEDVTSRLGVEPELVNTLTVKVLYEICQFEYAIYGKDTWCHVFSDVSLRSLEYRQDLRYYWRYGPGHSINYRPSCVLLTDIVGSWRKAIAGSDVSHQVAVRLGHSRTLLPLLTLLGMFHEDIPLKSDNMHLQTHRHWQLSHVNPFGANLALVLFRCNSGELKVKALLNERAILLPGCSDMLCPVQELVSSWLDPLSQCDLQQLCHTGGATVPALQHVSDLIHRPENDNIPDHK